MGLLMITVAFPLFSVHLKNKEYSLEVSGSSQVHCPNTEIDAVSEPPVAVRIGRLNSFWQNYVSISQELPDSRYVYSTISYFVIPSRHIGVHTKQFSCNKTGLLDYQLYMLQKSNLNLTVCISSTNGTFQGVRNITLCDTWPSYSNYRDLLINNCLEQHHLFVEPNGTNCTTLSFTAPRDSFYYLTTASSNRYSYTTVDSYRVNVNLRYLDSADLSDETPKCTSIGYVPNSCHIWVERKNLFHAEEYIIIATNAGDKTYGYIKVRQRYRSLAYIIPALAATALTLVGCSICLCGGICRKVIQMSRKRHRKQDYNSINN